MNPPFQPQISGEAQLLSVMVILGLSTLPLKMLLYLSRSFFTVHARTFGKYTGKKSAIILIPEITLVILSSAQTSAPIAFPSMSRVTMTPGC